MGGSANNITGQDNFSFNPDSLSYQFAPEKPWNMGDTGQTAIGQGLSQGISNLTSDLAAGIKKYKANQASMAANPASNPANYVGGNNPMYQGGLTYSPTMSDYVGNQLNLQAPAASPLAVINPSSMYMPTYWR